jgi:hypothetical protein
VEEYEVYEIRDGGPFGGPWIRRNDRVGMQAGHFLNRVYGTLDEAVEASQAARVRNIKRCAREMERLALNTNVKVRLLKGKDQRTSGGTE